MGKTETRPKNNQKISFIDENGEKYDGIYIEDEDMFFIGFDDTGDFIFASQVKSWEELN